MSRYRKLMIVVALIAALTMLATMTGVSFAAGGSGNNDEQETTCVVGYVINHREQPIDFTKFGTDKLASVAAPTVSYEMSAEKPEAVSAAEAVAATEAVTTTAPVTGTEAVTTTAPVTATEAVAAEAAAAAPGAELDDMGYWEYMDLPVGWYNFFLPLPPDWAGIVPQADRGGVAETGWTYLEERDEKRCHVVVFKIKREFDVTVLKWEEKLDGTVQPGEDWKITAVPQGDPFAVKDTDETDAQGAAVVTLTPGKWLISEQVKKGWMPITPASVYLTLDQYAAPGAIDPVVFKNREPVCYASLKVEKLGYSKDGTYLGPLAGWKVTLSRPDGKMKAITQTTDGSGKTTFTKLTPGLYSVKEEVQPGWEVQGDNPQQVVLYDCEEEDEASVLFENYETVGELKIEGRKLFKAWEKPYKGHPGVGLSGWLITATLKGSDPEIYTTTTTDAVGNYVFDSDTPGFDALQIPGATIRVCEEKRDHWIPVTPTCVDVTFPYPVPPAYMGAKKVDFTNMQDPPPGAAPSSSASNVSCSTTYVVQRGDTLSGIAAQYGTSIGALAQANGIANPNLVRAGQALCVQ